MSDKLWEIWNYCHNTQIEIHENGFEHEPFNQAQIVTLRKIQYMINHTCTDLSKLDKE